MAAASLAPSASLPGFLQSQPWAGSQDYLNGLPGLFNTTGLKNSYSNLESQNYNQGSAIAAAAANQYVQRQNQLGGSTAGAGFAQASAMLPVYQQNAQMNTQLQNQLLQYHAQQATIGAGLSGDIGRLHGGYQSTLADYLTTQQKLAQQNQQFGVTSGQQQQSITNQAQYQQGQLQNQRAQLALQYTNPASMGGFYFTNSNGGLAGNTPYSNAVGNQSKILGSLGFPSNPFSGTAGIGTSSPYGSAGAGTTGNLSFI